MLLVHLTQYFHNPFNIEFLQDLKKTLRTISPFDSKNSDQMDQQSHFVDVMKVSIFYIDDAFVLGYTMQGKVKFLANDSASELQTNSCCFVYLEF